MPGELETVDLEGVEILEADVRIHGVGSPPEGDLYTADDLRAMATAANELDGELRAPNKVGHADQQKLLRDSGITDGELPAAGWLENQRVEEKDGRTVLLTDIKDVPKKLAQLIEKKAYRTRSSELSKVKSQKTGKSYDWVVTGLAWLGGKMPAVRTLDDWVAKAYAAEGVELELRRVMAVGDVVWDPAQSLNAIRSDISEALNGIAASDPRFWVQDVGADGTALVSEGYDESDAYVVSWIRDADGTITVQASNEWVKAEKTWVETAKSYRAGEKTRPSDTRPTMADKTYTDDQRRKFAEATGLDADKVTDEMLAKAGVDSEPAAPALSDEDARKLAEALKVEGDEIDAAKLIEAAQAKVDPEQRKLEDDEVARRLEDEKKARESSEKRLEAVEEELRLEKRRSFTDELVKSGKIEPGEVGKWETRYDKDPTMAREFAADLKADENLLREYGSDDDESDEQRQMENYEDETAQRLGVPKEAVL